MAENNDDTDSVLGRTPRMVMQEGGPKLPPAAEAAIKHARQSGNKYMVAVWTCDKGNGNIDLTLHQGGDFPYDYLLRAMAMLKDLILKKDAPGIKSVREENGTDR